MPAIETEMSEETSALLAAVGWIEHLLRGTLGTAIALLAIALFGFAMLQGRLSLRDGLRIVLGCFVLFGAPAIAGGMVGAGRPQDSVPRAPVRTDSLQSPVKAPQFDPYAGAAVPSGQSGWP